VRAWACASLLAALLHWRGRCGMGGGWRAAAAAEVLSIRRRAAQCLRLMCGWRRRALMRGLAQQRRSASLLLWRHRSLARGTAGWRHATRGRRLELLKLRVGFAAARAALHAWREGALTAARDCSRSDRLRSQRPAAIAYAAAMSISPRISPRSHSARVDRERRPAAPPSPPRTPLAPRPPLCAAAWDAWVGQHAERVHARAQCGRAAAFWRLSRLIAATNTWQEACL